MYKLENSSYKEVFVKEEEKRRFSIYLPTSLIEYLDSLAEEDELGSRNQAVIQAIENHRDQGDRDEQV
jgi:metal-responsive CopG/Arc/MetJ family transcriptional regulator